MVPEPSSIQGYCASIISHRCHVRSISTHVRIYKVTKPEWVIPLRIFGDGAESYRALSEHIVKIENHKRNEFQLKPSTFFRRGKHKFEMLSLVLPLEKSSATMDSRVLPHGKIRNPV